MLKDIRRITPNPALIIQRIKKMLSNWMLIGPDS